MGEMTLRNWRPGDAIRALAEERCAPGAADLLTGHPDFCPERAWVALEDGAVRGFVCCTGEFLACALGQTAELLEVAEADAAARGLSRLQVNWFCPIRLPWVLPGTDGALHNNLPGVPEDSGLLPLLKSRGWQVRSRQTAMYLPLEDFSFPEELARQAEAMAEEGYTVDWYDSARHRGVDEMVESLRNSMWSAEIPAAARAGLPLLVGLSGSTVAGFTGPVRPEPCGRGYFAGIAVGPQWRGHGLGKLLFYRLLQAEQAAGARYMTLFTGVDNPAGRMYRKAGFRDVRTFAAMEKELL